MAPSPDQVNASLRAELIGAGMKYVMPAYVDLHGVTKTKIVPIKHFDQMAAGSELFTGAALDGVPQDVSDEEVAAHPDLNSAAVLPWNREIARFASDLHVHGQV